MVYDLVIIGGGPAGISAGIYAARKKLTTLFLTSDFGGQSIVSPDIHNWIGEPSISGTNLAKKLETHLRQYENNDLDIKTRKAGLVKKIDMVDNLYTLTTEANDNYQAKTVLITSGSKRRKLEIPGADKFDQKGLTYCASCDGPFFADKDVAIVGGGNAGFETASQLLAYAKSVTLLHHRANFKADQITVDKILAHPKMVALTEVETVEILGDQFVTGLTYRNLKTGGLKQLDVTGVFVEIGFSPNTDFVKHLVEVNNYGAIKVNPLNQQTSRPGLYAAGDCTDSLYHQNNIASGEGVKAVEDIYNYLHLKPSKQLGDKQNIQE